MFVEQGSKKINLSTKNKLLKRKIHDLEKKIKVLEFEKAVQEAKIINLENEPVREIPKLVSSVSIFVLCLSVNEFSVFPRSTRESDKISTTATQCVRVKMRYYSENNNFYLLLIISTISSN